MNELDKINTYTFETLGYLLFKMVPEYKTIFDLDIYKDEAIIGNYIFMNGFATELTEEMKKNSSSTFVRNSFNYINEIGESNNLEILNILRVGILEILYTSGESVRKQTEELLSSDKVKSIFNSFSKFYN